MTWLSCLLEFLTPPRIRYGRGEQSVDEKASWNLKNVISLWKARSSDLWTVLVIKDGNRHDEFNDAHDPELRSIIDGFTSMCRSCGISVIQTPPLITVAELPRKRTPKIPSDPKPSRLFAALLMATKQKPALLLVILSNGDKYIYAGLKHLCDVYLDVPNVCVQSAKIREGARPVTILCQCFAPFQG